MLNYAPPRPIRILLSALIGLLPLSSLQAESPAVTAVLSNSEVEVGEVVQLQIRVTGGKEASTPGGISVDGLEIHATGTSRNFEMHNFDVSQSVTYNYTILPLKSGTFKIPPQTIKVGNESLRTPELQLRVSGSAAGAGQSGSNPSSTPSQTGRANNIAFAELVVPKQSAYVGEMIPAEIRLGFSSRTPHRVVDGPEITGQGFTVQKLQVPQQPRLETVNGIPYEVWTFKTAISAARPGKVEIGPAQANAIVAVPRRQSNSRSRPRSPFDIFNMDDPFSDPFFADPFGANAQQQERITIKSQPATLEVKPLPPNHPPDFSGAVGNFAITVEANPKNVQVGDPITVTSTISGRGNFDRVSAPSLQDEQGWHKYPPSSKFKQDDDVGVSGSKTFETVLSPNEKKQVIPSFGFSFFDPVKEQYVSLKSDSIPIRVEGENLAVAAAPSASAPVASAPSPAATAVPQAPEKPADILYQLTDRPRATQSFAPLYLRRNFWLAQLIPLLALLGLVGWKARQARRQNKQAQRVARLQHEAAELMRKLRRESSAPREYYADASRVVQLKTALMTNSDPNTVDAAAVTQAFRLDASGEAALRRIFERNDEVRYSGQHNGVDGLSPEQRREVIDLIDHLQA
jgi:hypothetical protein